MLEQLDRLLAMMKDFIFSIIDCYPDAIMTMTKATAQLHNLWVLDNANKLDQPATRHWPVWPVHGMEYRADR